jgi:hypothetical protein
MGFAIRATSPAADIILVDRLAGNSTRRGTQQDTQRLRPAGRHRHAFRRLFPKKQPPAST